MFQTEYWLVVCCLFLAIIFRYSLSCATSTIGCHPVNGHYKQYVNWVISRDFLLSESLEVTLHFKD